MNLLHPLDRECRVDGRRLHLLDWGGEGRPSLLLLHGFTGHAHATDTLAYALQPYFHVCALDQRGHGDSDPAEEYSAAGALGDLDAVIEHFRLAPLVLVGFSMGGRNALYYASRRPVAVRRVVVVDIGPEIGRRYGTGPAGPPEPETWGSVEEAAQHLYRGNPYPGIHYYRWVASHSLRRRPDGALVWAWHPSIKERRPPDEVDWWAVVRSVSAPTLVLRGAESLVLDRDVAERMARELPDGRFVEIPRAVHMLHEDNPDAVVAALRAFLDF